VSWSSAWTVCPRIWSLIATGEQLPAFAALMRQGTWGRLRSTDPPITIPAWTCMMTGVPASRLGLYGFRHRRLGSYVEKIPGQRHACARAAGVGRAFARGPFGGRVGRSPDLAARTGQWIPGSDAPAAGSAAFTFPAELEAEIERAVGRYRFDVEGFRMGGSGRVLDAIRASPASASSCSVRFQPRAGAIF